MGFTFNENSKRTIKIEIEGKIYEMIDGQELKEKAEAIVELANPLEKNKVNDPEAYFEMCEKCINELLGDDAYTAIFNGREKDEFEHIDVILYIFDEIARSREGYMKEYLDRVEPQKEKKPVKKIPVKKRKIKRK